MCTYNIISKAHIATSHGGRDRMLKHLRQKYPNITTDAVELFQSYCVVCQEKRKCPKTTGVVVKPILSSEFNSRSQVDLVDMQSFPQGQFKWIIVYQCHHTKFVILRPLSSKRAAEVAIQLLDTFLIFGAPATFRVTTAQNSQPKSSQSSICSATEELCSSCWHQQNPLQSHVWGGP